MSLQIKIHIDKSLNSYDFIQSCFVPTFKETINYLFDDEIQGDVVDREEDSILTLCDAMSDVKYEPALPISIDNKIGDKYSNINSFQLPKESDLGNCEEREQLAINLTFAILSKLGIGCFHSRIFISYKRQETEQLALDLYKRLTAEKLGFEVFLDTRKLDVGAEFMDDIRLTIAESDIFLLLDSSSYMDGVYTKKELYTAMYSGAGIIRVFKKDKKTPVKSTSYSFESVEINNEDSNIEEASFQELVHTINKLRTKFFKAKLQRINEYRKLYDENLKSLWSIKQGDKLICPMWGVPSSQRIELLEKQVNRAHRNVTSFSILYDHWSVPKFHNEHIKWVVDKKNIQIETLQSTNMIESKKCPIVFLSASMPEDRNYDFAKVYNIVISLVEEVINCKGTLVFGGHPTITPIIANMMNLHKNIYGGSDYPNIYLYQSKFFGSDERPLENLEFPAGRIKNIDVCNEKLSKNESCMKSLALLREKMLDKTHHFTLGVFIGGIVKDDNTCGVWQEFELFCKNHPEAKRVAFTNTGTDISKLEEIGKRVDLHENKPNNTLCIDVWNN